MRRIRAGVTVMTVFGFEERKWRGWENEERMAVHVRMRRCRRCRSRYWCPLFMSQALQAIDYVLGFSSELFSLALASRST